MTHFVCCLALRRGEARRGVEWRGVKGTAIIGVPFKRGWRLRTARERWTEPRTPTYTHTPQPGGDDRPERGATTGTGSRTLEEEGLGLSAAGRRMAHLASLLLWAGDVETNQGPRFPACGCAAKESATPLCSAARTGYDTTPDVSASRQPTSAASPGSGEPGPAAPAQRRLPRCPPRPRGHGPRRPHQDTYRHRHHSHSRQRRGETRPRRRRQDYGSGGRLHPKS